MKISYSPKNIFYMSITTCSSQKFQEQGYVVSWSWQRIDFEINAEKYPLPNLRHYISTSWWSKSESLSLNIPLSQELPMNWKEKEYHHVALRWKKFLLGITRTIPWSPDLLNSSSAAVSSNRRLMWSASKLSVVEIFLMTGWNFLVTTTNKNSRRSENIIFSCPIKVSRRNEENRIEWNFVELMDSQKECIQRSSFTGTLFSILLLHISGS